MKLYSLPLRDPTASLDTAGPSGFLAGGRPFFRAPGFFSFQHLLTLLPSQAKGARETHHSLNTKTRPPDQPEPTFDCPLWPGCDCPGGAMRPECPGLMNRKSE